MPNDNFKPTVDLRQNAQPPTHPNPPFQKGRERGGAPDSSSLPFNKGEDRRGFAPDSNPPQPPLSNREGGKRLPKELEVEDKKEFQQINRPIYKPTGGRDWKALIVMMLILFAAGSYYWFVYRPRAAAPAEPPAKWYMVKLTDSETFYGQIKNTGADPVVIENVYYDYDQVQKKESGTAAEQPVENQAGSIRLVKRGKETHGPDGTLNVVRSQVLYMEPLADNSKVLKAIEEYEKGK